MEFVRLRSVDDEDMEKIRAAYDHFSVSRFISVDRDQ